MGTWLTPLGPIGRTASRSALATASPAFLSTILLLRSASVKPLLEETILHRKRLLQHDLLHAPDTDSPASLAGWTDGSRHLRGIRPSRTPSWQSHPPFRPPRPCVGLRNGSPGRPGTGQFTDSAASLLPRCRYACSDPVPQPPPRPMLDRQLSRKIGAKIACFCVDTLVYYTA